MGLYLNLNAMFRHPLSRVKRSEFRRSRRENEGRSGPSQLEGPSGLPDDASRDSDLKQREETQLGSSEGLPDVASRDSDLKQYEETCLGSSEDSPNNPSGQSERERLDESQSSQPGDVAFGPPRALEREQFEEMMLQLYAANSRLHRAISRNDELIRHHCELQRQLEEARAENAALTELDAVATDLKSMLTRVALADTVATQLSDAHDRLASRLELLTLEVSDVRRRVDFRGQQDGSDETRRLYLDLLESALTGILTRDGNAAPGAAEQFDPERRLSGRDWPKSAMTMIGTARMRNLRRLVETALTEGVAGDLLEAGVWRGGACIYMRGILAAQGVRNRTVWVADSFAGLPEPDETLYPADKGNMHHTVEELRVPLEEVKDNFERFGLLDEQVAFLPGWFKDTLPQAPIKQLAVLRLDGDMYSSTMETLRALYPRVARGGFIIVDDYILSGCRQAVDDFRSRLGIIEPLHDVDGAAVYWKRA
jgi:hypothetical protein